MAGPDEEVDRLEAQTASRLTAPVVVVAIVLVAALAALWVANRPPHRRSVARPRPLPSPSRPLVPDPRATKSLPNRGSVFLEHLSQCTHSDGQRYLTVAVGVTNLSDHALRLVSARPVRRSPGLRLDGVRVGARPCAATAALIPRRAGTPLEPSRVVVVSLRFMVGPECPRAGVVAARMTFEGARGALHADSSSLADLSSLPFVQCPG